MAYTIDFTSPIQVTVNGSSVTSPYTLKNGDKISATIAANSSGVWQGIKVTTSGTFSQSYRGETVNLDFSKVNIFLRGYDSYSTVATVVNISYTEAPPIQIDMTTLSNWSTITSGTHNVTLIAKADGYADSLPSTPVSFTRVFKTLKGLYKFIDVPEVVNASGSSYLNFVSNGKSFKQMGYGYIADMYQLQYANDTESITVKENSTAWVSDNYKFVDLGSTAQEVSDNFYTWFTTNTNVAYTVSTNLTNLTASAITPMIVGDTQTITLTASTNYNIPAQSAITVTGATITNYTKTSDTVCKITIGSVTGNITITASGVEQTTTISGKWKFNSDWEIKDSYEQTVNFTSNSQSFKSMHVNFMGMHEESQLFYDQTVAYGVNYGGTWTNTAYQTVDFGTATQTVGKRFYNWFTANAVEIIKYNITANLTNITADTNNVTTIEEGSTATLKYIANTGYKLPDTITVTGASYTWNKSTGTLTITNPTANIVITINGVAEMTTISGKYLYYGDPVWNNYEQTVNFTSNGKTYSKIKGVYTGMGAESPLYYDDTMVFDGDKGEWVNDSYKLIDFGTTPQSVTAVFYSTFSINAEPAKLMTAGKYVFNTAPSTTRGVGAKLLFTSNAVSYTGMGMYADGDLHYYGTSGFTSVYINTSGWIANNYRTFTLASDWYVQSSFLDFIKTNATKVVEYTISVSGLDSSVTISPPLPPKITSDDTLGITFTITDASKYIFNAQSDIKVTNATLTEYNKVSDTECSITISSATGNVTIADICKARASAPQNVKAENTVVSWDAVANADSYDVYVDGTLYENTTGETGNKIQIINTNVTSYYDAGFTVKGSDTLPVNDSNVLVDNSDGTWDYSPIITKYKYIKLSNGYSLDYVSSTGGCTLISISGEIYTFEITGNCTITIRTYD